MSEVPWHSKPHVQQSTFDVAPLSLFVHNVWSVPDLALDPAPPRPTPAMSFIRWMLPTQAHTLPFRDTSPFRRARCWIRMEKNVERIRGKAPHQTRRRQAQAVRPCRGTSLTSKCSSQDPTAGLCLGS